MLSRFNCVQLFATLWTVAHQPPLSLDSPGKNTDVGCYALIQGIFPTQGLKPHLMFSVTCVLRKIEASVSEDPGRGLLALTVGPRLRLTE